MKARIQKIDDTFVLRLPEAVAKEAKLVDGMIVDVDFAEGNFHVEPARPPKYKLEELIEGNTEENRHDEISWGKPQGREVW